MFSSAVGISDELPLQVTRVETRQARGTGAVPPAVRSMAGKTSIFSTGAGAAQRDQLAGLGEAVCRSAFTTGAAGDQDREDEGYAHCLSATFPKLGRFRLAVLIPLLCLAAACKPPPEQSHFMADADPEAGKAAIERVGCASCHTIPGVDWPKGKVGPSLDGLSGRGLIAGKLPNRPDVLSAYIRNAPGLVPGSGMPAMPVSVQESRDIAAYLYDIGAR